MKRIKQEQHIEIQEKSQQLKFRMQTEIQIDKHHALCQASGQLEELDYTKLYFAYSGIRKSQIEPRVLFKVLVCAYMKGVYSSRKIEEPVQFCPLRRGAALTQCAYQNGAFDQVDSIALWTGNIDRQKQVKANQNLLCHFKESASAKHSTLKMQPYTAIIKLRYYHQKFKMQSVCDWQTFRRSAW